MQSRTGRNPGAVAWESNIKNRHYNPRADKWEGHCNGWAAAAMLVPEPREKVTRNNITFETADLKGILSEQFMNTYCNFYGTRYWGPDNNYDDIFPEDFHRLLMKYLGEGRSAIIADIDPGIEVWNFPIFRFESSWTTGWFNKRKLKVTTKVWIADGKVAPEFIGTKWFTKTYTYDLFVDHQGNIINGAWTGASRRDHPDFVWVPTVDAPNPHNGVLENPKIDPRFVKEIIEGIPQAPPVSRSVGVHPDKVLMEAGLDPGELF